MHSQKANHSKMIIYLHCLILWYGCFQKSWYPQIIHLFIGFSNIFTIHFGGQIPLFLGWHPYDNLKVITPVQTHSTTTSIPHWVFASCRAPTRCSHAQTSQGQRRSWGRGLWQPHGLVKQRVDHLGILKHPKDPWTLQWRGERTYMTQGCLGVLKKSHWIEGSGYLGHKCLDLPPT